MVKANKKDTVIFTGNGDEINIYKCDFIETPESITFIGIKALEKAILDAAHGLKPGAVFTVDMPGDIDYEWSCDIAKEFTEAVLKVTQSANAAEEIFVQIVWETNNGDECFVQGTFSRFIGVKLSESAYAYAPARKGKHAAAMFFHELLDSVETLTSIAVEHGPRTLEDLMYLQNAILSGGFIDHYPSESKVLEIANAMPSGEQWSKFIKVKHLASSR
jgi:hypothetical protein